MYSVGYFIVGLLCCHIGASSIRPLDTNYIPKSDNRDISKTYRLPNNTKPESYTIQITTNIHVPDYNFSGKIEIKLKALEDTNSITLHARQLITLTAELRDGYDQIIVGWSEIDKDTDHIVFTTKNGKILKRDQLYLLAITYTGEIQSEPRGFYRSSYRDNNTDKQVFVF